MKTENVVLLSFLTFILFASCGQQKKEDSVFTIDDFTKTVQLEGDDLGIYLNGPSFVKFIPGGYLLFNDVSENYLAKIYELSSGREQLLLRKGRGPGEANSIWGMSTDGNGFILSAESERKMFFYQPGDSMFAQTKVIAPEHGVLEVTPAWDGYIMVEPDDGNRFELIDDKGSVVDSLGSFPDLGGEISPDNSSLQSSLAVDPVGKKTVSVYRRMDYIELYEGAKLVKRMHGPDQEIYRLRKVQSVSDLSSSDIIGMEVTSGGQILATVITPSKIAWQDVYIAPGDGFYVGRIGINVNGTEDEQKGISSIFKFSLDGEPETIYRLDHELVTFAMDPDAGVFYGVTTDMEPKVLSFKF